MADRAAIYAGSFDPLTNGHIDIVKRGLKTFDRIVLAVANNPNKSHTFDIEKRMEMARAATDGLGAVEVDTFGGLLVDFARKKGINTLLRGLRAVSDFEYEFQLATMNHNITQEVETVFMMTSEEWFYLSSRLVREVARFGGDVEKMVPKAVYQALTDLYGKSH